MRPGGNLLATVVFGAIALAACSNGRPADAPPPPVDNAFAVCAPDPDAGWAPCGCEDPKAKKAKKPKAPDGGVATAAQKPGAPDADLSAFLRRLGAACADKELAFLESSVRFPLRWREIVNENVDVGRPVTRTRRIASPKELCAKNVFAGLQGVDPAFPIDPAFSPLRTVEIGPKCRVGTLVGQFGAALVLEKTGSTWTLVALEAGD
jgi:hypothetical protein